MREWTGLLAKGLAGLSEDEQAEEIADAICEPFGAMGDLVCGVLDVQQVEAVCARIAELARAADQSQSGPAPGRDRGAGFTAGLLARLDSRSAEEEYEELEDMIRRAVADLAYEGTITQDQHEKILAALHRRFSITGTQAAGSAFARRRGPTSEFEVRTRHHGPLPPR